MIFHYFEPLSCPLSNPLYTIISDQQGIINDKSHDYEPFSNPLSSPLSNLLPTTISNQQAIINFKTIKQSME